MKKSRFNNQEDDHNLMKEERKLISERDKQNNKQNEMKLTKIHKKPKKKT